MQQVYEINFPLQFLQDYFVSSLWKPIIGFWLRTQERYNDAISNPTIKRIQFSKYENFKDSTIDASKGK